MIKLLHNLMELSIRFVTLLSPTDRPWLRALDRYNSMSPSALLYEG